MKERNQFRALLRNFMSKNMKRSIESIPEISIQSDEKRVILKLEDLLIEKPRASIKEIDATHRLIKMIYNEKRYSYRAKKSVGK
ncbi:MAG: hypothetical protein KAS63_01010 [Candidatus Heimdallarchaeota archaeon]|nr:hypothetical protein [Candidatus Heimdallarchaeota archaeon]MCK4953922.1 hypothetical protein [Candidatus Heimdallarchaeota archaeon]